VTQN